MRYRLDFTNSNHGHVQAYAAFFKRHGMDPYGVFEEYEEADIPPFFDPKYHVVLKMSNYYSPRTLFEKQYFYQAEAQTKLEDWL